ncbi:MAG: ribonuclease, partial [Novosphingobium sp.]|nr:ribonuclease [Novosphingobium sp.]
RAILVEGGSIIAARLFWPGRLTAGQVDDAVLVSRTAGSRRGTVRFGSGEEALIDSLPREASEGAAIRVIVTRAAIAETGRFKLARVRPSKNDPCGAPSLAEHLAAGNASVSIVRGFPLNGWSDVFHEAWEGHIDFPGGSLTISPTPAMTVIDIDGLLPPAALARAAVEPVGQAIRRFDIAGSIGIDFPTLDSKEDRRAVDAALDTAIANWPHERTAMNGFGFVQLVARLERPSILHLIANNRAKAAARLLLRQAERIAEPGALLLTAHPGVLGAIKPEWLTELARRSGREVRYNPDPALALQSGFAQAVPR